MSKRGGSANFGASALGNGPNVELAPGQYLNASGMSPGFPSTENLHHGAFKVVVGSWKRLNEDSSGTADFAVNVAAYSRKVSPVTRVQLVDVDIPCTQQLIEDAWSNLYFSQGVVTQPDCRTLFLTTTTGTFTVALPLLFDTVSTYQKLGGNRVRLFTTHRAPTPIRALAAAWCGLAARGCGIMQLVGVPGLGVLQLTPDMVADDTTVSFEVLSSALYAALPDEPECDLYLYASSIPGPGYLAKILSRAMDEALEKSPALPCGGSLPDDSGLPPLCTPDVYVCPWVFDVMYYPLADRFAIIMRSGYSPAQECALSLPVTLGGDMAMYMGFGTNLMLDVPTRDTITVQAHNPRFQGPLAFADVSSGDPRRGTDLAAMVQGALNTYTWTSFQFGITFPGNAPVTIAVPGGHMTLPVMAGVLTTLLAPYNIVATVKTSASATGIGFATTADAVFALDMTVDTVFEPRRLGYDRRAYSAAYQHYPSRHATHIPLMTPCCTDACLPLRSDVVVTYRADTEQLVFQSQPFAPMAAVVAAPLPAEPCCVMVVSTAPVVHGLQTGAKVVLAWSATEQSPGFVLEALSATTVSVVLESCDSVPVGVVVSTPVTLVPLDMPPLDLYLQRIRPRAFLPEILGFQPRTYETCWELVSPGTIDLTQDPYILLCLGFDSPEGEPTTGDVYYPFPLTASHCNLVFAKVLRTVAFKTDFDKVYDHCFPGAGTYLGYVHVRVLNPDGTLYQTHGHSVSITLKFDVREASVQMGGGTVSVFQPGAPPASAEFMPLARGNAVVSSAHTQYGAANVRRR